MPKRRLQDTDDTGASAGGSKRARFDQSAPQVHEFNATEDEQTESSAKRKGKQHANDEMDIEDDEHASPSDTDDEAELERETRESYNQRKNRPATSAKYAIIEKVEMYQFMCHQHLTFNFGPRINFIIGHNGSGKSAVLSAITIGLGGKANSTGRGNGLKAFIREGQHASEVSIHLKNQGEEAYRHYVYGDSIVITRRFTREGSSTYAIKSKSGKKISGKREELSAICDYMNIQVDNPMNILTQDASRQFLNSANASDKYKFFLQGTLLAQLDEDYQLCDDNINRMSQIVEAKRGGIADFKNAYDDAERRLDEAKAARDRRNKVDDLKKELAWAIVDGKEKELEAQVATVTKVERRIEKLQEKFDTARKAFEVATAEVLEKERAHEELGNIDHLYAQETALKAKISARKREKGDLKLEEANVNSEVQSIRSEIENLNSQKRAEMAKSASRADGTHETLLRRLEQVKADLESAGTALRIAEDKVVEKRAEHAAAQTAFQQSERDKTQANVDRQGARQQRMNMEGVAQDDLAVFGRGLHGVLGVINQTQWYGDMPIGPFGRYVKARDGQWADALRHQIGRLMAAFALTDLRDRATLAKILKDSGNGNAPIIVAGLDLFDYSRGEPDAQYLTILRVVEISNEYVKRVLVNQARIERTMLFHKRAEADTVLKAQRGGGMAVTQDGFIVTRYRDGGGLTDPLQNLPRNDRRHLMFTNRDSAAQILHLRQSEQDAERTYSEAVARAEQLRLNLQSADRELKDAQTAAQRAATEVTTTRRKRDQLQEEVKDDESLGVAGLDEALDELEDKLRRTADQFEPIARRQAEVADEIENLTTELDNVKHTASEFHQRKAAALEEAQNAGEERTRKQSNMLHWETKLAEEQTKLQGSQQEADRIRQEYEGTLAKATEYSARVQTERSQKIVEREITAVEKALEERERRGGASVEDMQAEVDRTKVALDSLKGDLADLDALTKLLRECVNRRKSRWNEFRRHMSYRCMNFFQLHLSNRGYSGHVELDHANGTLILKVRTERNRATQEEGTDGGSQARDTRALSGGEKSFTTTCFLLAMWDTISSPIRCLDEFDVFMDDVTRRVACKMIIDAANASGSEQYIFITPKGMDNIQIGNTVRVHRMRDPERSQGTLAFGNSVAA